MFDVLGFSWIRLRVSRIVRKKIVALLVHDPIDLVDRIRIKDSLDISFFLCVAFPCLRGALKLCKMLVGVVFKGGWFNLNRGYFFWQGLHTLHSL